MQLNYKGETVSFIRDAVETDQGYDATKDQIVVRYTNGTDKVIERSEAAEAKQPEAVNPEAPKAKESDDHDHMVPKKHQQQTGRR